MNIKTDLNKNCAESMVRILRNSDFRNNWREILTMVKIEMTEHDLLDQDKFIDAQDEYRERVARYESPYDECHPDGNMGC